MIHGIKRVLIHSQTFGTNGLKQFNEQEKELEQRALLWAFRAERQYLDMVSQKENRRDYLFEFYNEILLAESILLDTENEY
ncbi:hypothetical protein [Limosilactobacillus reuteri]|uniref:hypothetical protein n=1 Tax=Limosilactobacillus reuteri TaxID=1598 RepID=UPI001CDD5A55|nr:hypothetical protein [Limosilactobacillus reuteri]